MILISDNKPSIVSDPAESALDYISSPVSIPESVVLSIDIPVVFPVRSQKVDTSFSQTLASGIAVVCLVSDHSFGPSPGSSWSSFRDLDVREDFVKELDLSRRGRVGIASQRNTLAIDHHQALCSLAPLGRSDRRAPFFAGMNVASTNASSQSRTPFSSSSERKARHISLRRPVSCHVLSRRQQTE
jgi:hypothetical protein